MIGTFQDLRVEIRMLSEADAQAFQALRLRSLREHPEAFGAAFEEEQSQSIEAVAERLRGSSPENFTLGAIGEGRLVGIVGLYRYPRAKSRHKAGIWGMYVAPEAAGKGVGRALLAEAIARARLLEGLEEIVLAVTVGNDRPRSLYVAAGFEPYCVEPRYIKLGDRYFDIEWMTLSLNRGG